MDRKEFFSKVGFGAAIFLVPACIAGLATSCESEGNVTPAPTNVDFTLDTTTGNLANPGGFLVHNGIVVARTLTGGFLAVSASCTHQGTNVNYNSANNNFVCPNHGALFSSTGAVTRGPASSNLTSYIVDQVTPTQIRVHS
jgi:cytochrome b6-f complex iron-sulfur subunit